MTTDSPRVHPAAEAFDRAADAYERGRPEYPSEAVRWLADKLGLRPGRRVVELGSGTGKFTRALRGTGAEIVAVEPSTSMRETFRRQLPDMEVRDGTAEAIPLPDASVDTVVVAQAFHWFRQPVSLDEIGRVVRPGGGLGLVWNLRDERVPWVAEFGRLLDGHEGPGVPRTRLGAWKAAFEGHPAFPTPESVSFPWTQEGDAARFVDRALSVSFIAEKPPEVRERVADGVRSLLATHPDTAGKDRFTMPYVTSVYWTFRR